MAASEEAEASLSRATLAQAATRLITASLATVLQGAGKLSR